ncbi:LysR family transcriptional regulator [Roseovarius sp. 217]|uniref:LysR family transcriptional regulator n=1 Tax=Roseovarius sp. (strain 217) TaxID=314264 RepID=UPI0000685B59|nr:LysR family transcriptional regulator [Roseovarius sp. 217]EAQ26816.1 transcriptional regulatory protein [Roseovarius sp. 217]
MINRRYTDLNLLRIFHVVMLERNMTRAAARLNMTQPSVSNAIQRLREVLADDLFIKVSGGVVPTAKAEAIWPTIRNSIQSLIQTIDPERFEPSVATDSFRIAMSDFVATQLILPVAGPLFNAAPHVSLVLCQNSVDNIVPGLIDGQFDMAAGVIPYKEARIRSILLKTLTYVCAMRKDHPLAKEPLTFADFMAARHLQVSLSGRSGFIDRYLTDRGMFRDIALTIRHYTLAPEILSSTDLIAILPSEVISHSHQYDLLKTTAPPIPVYEDSISLLWHERNDAMPAHRWMRERLIDIVKAQTTSIVPSLGKPQAH